MNTFKPMLAASLLPPHVEHTNDNILAAMRKLKLPVIATLKKDGIRAVKTTDLFSRSMNLIPNVSVRRRAMKIPAGYDMELWNSELRYEEVESIVMSEEHEDSDKIQFHILDNWKAPGGYHNRVLMLGYSMLIEYSDIVLPSTFIAHTPEQLLNYFLLCEHQDGEGICFRTPDSPYKYGRSTLKEQYLVKLARYVRTELVITGFEEQMENTNAVKRNALGKMDRAKCLQNLKPKNTLGAFICRMSDGTSVRVGAGVGLSDIKRKEVWLNRDAWLGKTIVVKNKPYGQKNKLRSPIYIGERRDV